MSTYSNSVRNITMPDGNEIIVHADNSLTADSTQKIRKTAIDDNGHVTGQSEAKASDLGLSSNYAPATQDGTITSSITTEQAISILDKRSSVNQTNILLVKDATEELVDKGAKNLLNSDDYIRLSNLMSYSNGTCTVQQQEGDTLTNLRFRLRGYETTSSTTPVYSTSNIEVSENGKFFFTFTKSNEWSMARIMHSAKSSDPAADVYIAYDFSDLPDGDYVFACNVTNCVKSVGAYTWNSMVVCTKAEWEISQKLTDYALPNYDLTVREQQDRNTLVEVVDEGAKNVLDLCYENNYTPASALGLTATLLPDGTISVTGTPTTTDPISFRFVEKSASYFRKFSGYYLSGSVTPSGNVTRTQLMFELASSPYTRYGISENGNPSATPMDFPDISNLTYFFVRLFCANTTTPVNLTFKPMITTKAKLDVSKNYAPHALPNTDLTRMMAPFFTVPINHNMIYRGQNLGETFTEAQDTALSSGNFTDLYLGDYWTKTVTIPAFYELTTAEPADWSTNYTSYYTKSGDTYTPVSGDTAPTWAADTYYERLVPSQTVTLKAVIADFDTFYAGYASSYAGINTHHAAVIVTGFSNVVWNKTNSTAGGYVASLIHKWLVGSALPQIETWFGSAKVLSHQKLLTNAITGNAASGWAWSSQKISLLSENQMYGSKVWGNSKAANGGYEPGEAFKHLNVFNHIDANLLFGNKNIWLRDIASAVWAARLDDRGGASGNAPSTTGIAPAALILLS